MTDIIYINSLSLGFTSNHRFNATELFRMVQVPHSSGVNIILYLKPGSLLVTTKLLESSFSFRFFDYLSLFLTFVCSLYAPGNVNPRPPTLGLCRD